MIKQRLIVLRLEVADADCADSARGKQRLQRLGGSNGQIEVRRERLMEDEQEVDLADTELGGALVDRVYGFLIPAIADPDLGLDEDLGAR